MASIDIPPAFINVLVIIVPCADGSGNMSDGLFNVTTVPAAIKVTRPNTILNYQIIPPTPDVFVFAGMERKPSAGIKQLSNGSVSLDGKMLTLSDWNTTPEAIALTLVFSNGQGSYSHDPQIQNTPEEVV